jgi:hypothetical protein
MAESCLCDQIDRIRVLWQPLGARCMCAAVVTGRELLIVLDPAHQAAAYREAGRMLESAFGPGITRLLKGSGKPERCRAWAQEKTPGRDTLPLASPVAFATAFSECFDIPMIAAWLDVDPAAAETRLLDLTDDE